MAGTITEHDSVSEAEAIDQDERLIAAAKEDVEAFGRLYDKYYHEISRYIYHRTFDHALTEDLTSNTFYAAFRHIQRFKWKRIPFGAWLYRIATNEIRMHYRKQKQASVISLQTENEAEQRLISGLQTSSFSASEQLIAAEQYARLHQAILTLKPIYQAVITLRFFEGQTIKEISKIIGRREGTVKSQLHRGLELLRETLALQGIVDIN